MKKVVIVVFVFIQYYKQYAYKHSFTGNFHLEPVYREPVPHESEITFTIPSKGRFASLKKSDLSAEEVKNATDEEVPPFLGKYRDDLARKRFVPKDVSVVAISPPQSTSSFTVSICRTSFSFSPAVWPIVQGLFPT